MDFEIRRARIVSMLRRGVLPHQRGVAFDLHHASGNACRACAARIPTLHVEYHLSTVDASTIVLCGRCFTIWLVERFGTARPAAPRERRCLVCEAAVRDGDRVASVDGRFLHERCARLERPTGS